ncbi:amidohydrolase [Halalkalirubrum salinum]|uniref:amidohydrolase n=1 Tax=Halalkalirubrum salinum TaxID=2563889 RepID=UPI0010FB8E76|nr:amidohydrolase [Halalkalirubrum salinum]
MEYSDLSVIELRRDLHCHPEVGWTEFRTTAIVAAILDELGFELALGANAVNEASRLGVPSSEEIAAARQRALDHGAPEEYLEQMGDVTGLVATKRYGDGPTVGIRIDMDALKITESTIPDHAPAREEFISRHRGLMHACGHDGHTAIGVGVARAINRSEFDGTLKLFFQPAEEGGRGGKPMSETDHLEAVDHFMTVHLGLGHETGTIIAGRETPLPNTKYDVRYEGAPSHAGHAPNEGRNALQAMSAAIQNLYAIPRHGDGGTRVNIGEVSAPNQQNVIADQAMMRVELRGETPELENYMTDEAVRIVEAAAEMHDVDVARSVYGQTTTFEPDGEMVGIVSDAANAVPDIDHVILREPIAGSEDASFLIRRVQETGGTATYIGIGASNPSGHHTSEFDIDEDAIELGIDLVAEAILQFAA